MELYRVSPAVTRRLALVGALALAVSGWLPHHICWDDPMCAVPWLSLVPVVLALAVLRRGWTTRLATAVGFVAAAFWVAGLIHVLTNVESVVTDILIGTPRAETLHRLAAAGYLYGGTLSFASFTVHAARRYAPGERRPVVAVSLALAALPAVGLVAVSVGRVDAVLMEALPEVVTVLAVVTTGLVVTATVRAGGLWP
ncbi:MAG: hypothetical protein ABEJ68_02705 [Halobacteriaceae archaeon]